MIFELIKEVMESLNEVKVQFALGTYYRWYIHIWTINRLEDPPGLNTILHDELPYCELWSGGMYMAYGTEFHMHEMKYSVLHIINPAFEKGFDFHRQDVPEEYFKMNMRIEREDNEGIKKVWI